MRNSWMQVLDAGSALYVKRGNVYFGALWRERRVISAGEMAGGRVSFSDTIGYLSKIRVQF